MVNMIILQYSIRIDKGSYPDLSGHLSPFTKEDLPLFYEIRVSWLVSPRHPLPPQVSKGDSSGLSLRTNHSGWCSTRSRLLDLESHDYRR